MQDNLDLVESEKVNTIPCSMSFATFELAHCPTSFFHTVSVQLGRLDQNINQEE